MTAHRLISRRLLLKDMGKAGLALMVMGTAACAAERTETATPTDEAGPATTTGPDPATTTSPVGTTPSTGPGQGGHRWHRVEIDFVSAYILYRGGEAVIVDTGVEGSSLVIEAGLGQVGLGWEDVGGLIVTHKHPDHQGSVRGVLDATTGSLPWFAGAADLPAITAPTAGQAVGDGDTVDGGLEIIETPGHTPGHISVLDPVAGVLVAGDALIGDGGGVAGPSPGPTEDPDRANASVAKLAGFDYEIVLFGHGVPVLSGAATQVAELAETLGG